MPVDDLIRRVAVDRLELSATHLSAADHLLRESRFRMCVGRFYYAMYHVARAAAFVAFRGDDYERHAVLPQNLPSDLRDVDALSQDLQFARLLRNDADYDPYPASDQVWEADARGLSATASSFCAVVEQFVRSELESGI
ncbi:HEPN domain-containing protein [Demequina sp. NBRC 110052]|uniref:HEPN domain-containing protein n=1 Tax=Demequina sp. NBRC 110052 TaxID=1570341 RepID=UPI000A076DEE